MSHQRLKRNKVEETMAGKRKRRKYSGSEDDEYKLGASDKSSTPNNYWTPKHLSDLKTASIYNRSAAELFRKDLISAMKLPDNEPLKPEEFWNITDQWKQEWERGVQVPVDPENLPQPLVNVINRDFLHREHDFRYPKHKYIRINHDDFFSSEKHQLSTTPARADKVCRYDLDECDVQWLKAFNGERAQMSLSPVCESTVEYVIEDLETQCWEHVQALMKEEEGLGIEYDENVICDVCRSPDSEEGNEMVFCDSCNICVHQACYGITSIPRGSWLCRTCTLGTKPSCALCPNKSGAMKSTKSGSKWAHVSCALWIPEVSIGDVETMEPITKINNVPASRWALVCVLCREKVGACIQCSVRSCKVAYHVTCAFKQGLVMKAIIEDEQSDDGVKLKSYCQKHSVRRQDRTAGYESEREHTENTTRRRREITAEQRSEAKASKLSKIESSFYEHVDLSEISQNVDVDPEVVDFIFYYWKLKRTANFNRPLLAPKSQEVDLLTQQQEQDIEKMKMFVHLRQDLERVRNLCYMVTRREKFCRTYIKLREQTFHKQHAVLTDAHIKLSGSEIKAVLRANQVPSIYDTLYSCGPYEANSASFDTTLALIRGEYKEIEKKELNGLIKSSHRNDNPYKKNYVNGSERRRLSYSSRSSASDSDSMNSFDDKRSKHRHVLPPKSDQYSSSEESCIKKNNCSKTKSLFSDHRSDSSAPEDILSDSMSSPNFSQNMSSTVKTKAAVKDFSCKVNKKAIRTKEKLVTVSHTSQTMKSGPESDFLSSNKHSSKSYTSSSSNFVEDSTSKESMDEKSEQKNSMKKVHEQSESLKAKKVLKEANNNVSRKLPDQLMKDSESERKVLSEFEKSITCDIGIKKNKPGVGRKREIDTLTMAGHENNREVLSYVPQRQAAKKATESITGIARSKDLDELLGDNKGNKYKKILKPEDRPFSKLKPHNHVDVGFSLGVNSSDSSDSEGTAPNSRNRKYQLKQDMKSKLNRKGPKKSIFSFSEDSDDSDASMHNHNKIDKAKRTYIRSFKDRHNENKDEEFDRLLGIKKESIPSKQTSVLDGSLDTSNTTISKVKKAPPGKKLKTSDGRANICYGPPATKRNESRAQHNEKNYQDISQTSPRSRSKTFNHRKGDLARSNSVSSLSDISDSSLSSPHPHLQTTQTTYNKRSPRGERKPFSRNPRTKVSPQKLSLPSATTPISKESTIKQSSSERKFESHSTTSQEKVSASSGHSSQTSGRKSATRSSETSSSSSTTSSTSSSSSSNSSSSSSDEEESSANLGQSDLNKVDKNNVAVSVDYPCETTAVKSEPDAEELKCRVNSESQQQGQSSSSSPKPDIANKTVVAIKPQIRRSSLLTDVSKSDDNIKLINVLSNKLAHSSPSVSASTSHAIVTSSQPCSPITVTCSTKVTSVLTGSLTSPVFCSNVSSASSLSQLSMVKDTSFEPLINLPRSVLSNENSLSEIKPMDHVVSSLVTPVVSVPKSVFIENPPKETILDKKLSNTPINSKQDIVSENYTSQENQSSMIVPSTCHQSSPVNKPQNYSSLFDEVKEPLVESKKDKFDDIIKEDTQEDSTRETLNLIEKLRLQYAKVTGSKQDDEDDQDKEEPIDISDMSKTSEIHVVGEPPPAIVSEAISLSIPPQSHLYGDAEKLNRVVPEVVKTDAVGIWRPIEPSPTSIESTSVTVTSPVGVSNSKWKPLGPPIEISPQTPIFLQKSGSDENELTAPNTDESFVGSQYIDQPIHGIHFKNNDSLPYQNSEVHNSSLPPSGVHILENCESTLQPVLLKQASTDVCQSLNITPIQSPMVSTVSASSLLFHPVTGETTSICSVTASKAIPVPISALDSSETEVITKTTSLPVKTMNSVLPGKTAQVTFTADSQTMKADTALCLSQHKPNSDSIRNSLDVKPSPNETQVIPKLSNNKVNKVETSTPPLVGKAQAPKSTKEKISRTVSQEFCENKLKVRERKAPNPTRVPVCRDMYKKAMVRKSKDNSKSPFCRRRASPIRASYLEKHSSANDLAGTVYEFDDDFDEIIQDKVENLRSIREHRDRRPLHEITPIPTSDLINNDSEMSSTSTLASDLTTDSHPPSRLPEPSASGAGLGIANESNQSKVTNDMDIVASSQFLDTHNGITYGISPYLSSKLTTPLTLNSLSNPYMHPSSQLPPVSPYVSFLDPSKDSDYSSSIPEPQSTISLSDIKPDDSFTASQGLKSSDELSISPTISATTTVQTFKDSSSTPVIEDSRNQLKVKIKGPFLDANYSSNSSSNIPAPPGSDISTSSSTTVSTLRRMRKKELIRQYQNQDNPETNVPSSVTNLPYSIPNPLPRTGITIPKAVASMTVIPTRDDYLGFNTGQSGEVRKRKRIPRELRNLELKGNSEDYSNQSDSRTLRDRGISNSDSNDKIGLESGGVSKGSHAQTILSSEKVTRLPPKLRINLVKLESFHDDEDNKHEKCSLAIEPQPNTVNPVQDDLPLKNKRGRGRGRKPKKQSQISYPTLQDLKRESLRFREIAFADLEQNTKEDKDKQRTRNKKIRKLVSNASVASVHKKLNRLQDELEAASVIVNDSPQEVQIINKDTATTSAPKIIIKFGKKTLGDTIESSDITSEDNKEEKEVLSDLTCSLDKSVSSNLKEPCSEESKEYKVEFSVSQSEPIKQKVTPIKLRLSRASEGYISKSTAPISDKVMEPLKTINGNENNVERCEVR